MLALGAAGAWLGTRFVATREGRLHERYTERVVEAPETGTVISEHFDGGWPGTPRRVLGNSTTTDWIEAGRPPSGDRPGEGVAVAILPDGRPVARYDLTLPPPDVEGNVKAAVHSAGQSAGGVDDGASADAVDRSLIAEATAALDRLSG